MRGSSNIARILRVSPLLIGLTIVAFGTSFHQKEEGQHPCGYGRKRGRGNVVGSNILNSTLIVGVTAILMLCRE
ncbi:hypothetical protein [Thalassobacillus sp. C254]|uniref:hypothetical protein n=1 Tax=Thalassobacillus sp. C254 TaxID=1225341 RepID=UPI0022B63C8C|nr:hypothetical protein [Thalassobacillus sp. C254]